MSKKMLLFFAVLLCCGCAKTGCLLDFCPENGHAAYRYSNGVVYEGEVLNGRAWGKGIATWPNGMRYVGDFVDGDVNGQGIMTEPSGFRYEGAFANNTYSGQGILLSPTGFEVAGQFLDGKLNGPGTMTIPGGTKHLVLGNQYLAVPVSVVISGQWVNNELRDGRIDWSDGRSYIGALDSGKRVGNGVTKYADGRRLCGAWADIVAAARLTPEQFEKTAPVIPCAKE